MQHGLGQMAALSLSFSSALIPAPKGETQNLYSADSMADAVAAFSSLSLSDKQTALGLNLDMSCLCVPAAPLRNKNETPLHVTVAGDPSVVRGVCFRGHAALHRGFYHTTRLAWSDW